MPYQVALIRVPNYLLFDERMQAPLGLLYLAAFLRKHGVKVVICDLAGEPRQRWADLISPADIHGLSLTTGDVPIGSEVAQTIRALYPRSLLVAGGAHPSALPEDTLSHGFDVAVVGPGEEPLLRLAHDEAKGRILYGRIPKDLSGLPLPAWDLVPDVISYNLVEKGEPSSCLCASMGCPYNCSFCAQDVWQRRYLDRPIEEVYHEAKFLKEEYGITETRLVDELTMANRHKFIQLCEALGRLGLRWRTHTRADLACRNKDLLKVAADNGCVELAIGVENPDDHILKLVNKGITVAQCSEALQAIKDAGIKSKAYFMVGLPGESPETIEGMKKWIKVNNPSKTTLSTFSPFPKCDIFLHSEKYNYKMNHGNNWKLFWMLGMEETNAPFVGETEFMTNADLMKARKELYAFMIENGYKDKPPEGWDAARGSL